jgi:hypothetical protein
MTTMNGTYKVMLRCRPNDVQLLVTDMGDDILKAQLTSSPAHPRALVTLLEGLALWQGATVCVAASASEGAQGCCERVLYGGGLLGPVSPLVSVEHRLIDRRPRRLRGLGDFRQLRLLGGAW